MDSRCTNTNEYDMGYSDPPVNCWPTIAKISPLTHLKLSTHYLTIKSMKAAVTDFYGSG